MPKSIYFARQPILDIHGQTYAYELLYRSSYEQSFSPIQDDQSATAQVLVNALNLIGIKNLLGDAFAFINTDKSILMDDMILSIPKEHFVLELLETIVIDEELIQRIKELKEKGYRFALDDADCSKEYVLNFQPVFKYMDILKLDITLVDEKRLPKFLELFSKFNIKVLAEKVETQEEFDKYKEFGCHYFQGYFFAKPDIIENKRLDPEQLFVLNIISKLQGECDPDEISHLFEQNVAITLQLLRFINSAAFAFRSPIKSIKQAITLLGQNQLKSWLLLISYATKSNDNQTLANPLLHLAQTRANMMKTLYKVVYKDKCNQNVIDKAAFIGLLSLVEALFQSPMQTILNELNVDEEIIQTLLYYKSDLGKIYKLVAALEVFDVDVVDYLVENLHLDKKEFSTAVEESYQLTESFMKELSA